MLGDMASNAVFAKCRAKYGRRLVTKNFKDMAGLVSVAEIASYLKSNTHYAPVLQGVQDSALHRGNLERMLKYKLYDDLFQLSHFERAVGERFFLYFVINWEIEELIDFLTFLIAGCPHEYLLTLSTSIDDISPLDLVDLSTANTYDEFLEKIKGTPFASVLHSFAPESGENKDLYLPAIESALLKFRYKYCKELFENHFTGETRKDLMFLLNMRYELLDIRTTIRAKSFGDWSPGIIKSQLIGAKCLIPPKQMEEILTASTGEQSLSLFSGTAYQKYLRQIDRDEHSFIDDLTMRILYMYASRKIHFSTKAPVVMFALSICFDVELENITNIIEGVRYSVHPDSIGRLLILEEGS